jgi:TolB protein
MKTQVLREVSFGKLKSLGLAMLLVAFVFVSLNTGHVHAAFPGQNGKIAYVFVDNVYAANTDGSNAQQLTTSSADLSPKWSPDGTKIVFTSVRDGDYDVYVMNADGSGQADLTNTTDFEYQPDWSPDGTKIIFATSRDGDSEIYTMNVDGSNPVNISNSPASDEFVPTWSPDGNRIAFSSNRDGNTEIYVMNADGSGQARITNNSSTDDSPNWSPSGSRIAFSSNRDVADNIYTMNPDGTSLTQLTFNVADDGAGGPGTQQTNLGPYWSPDGTQISFRWYNGALDDQIRTMNANGSNVQNVTTVQGAISYGFPTWQPLAAVTPPVTPSAASPTLAETGQPSTRPLLITGGMILAALLVIASLMHRPKHS